MGVTFGTAPISGCPVRVAGWGFRDVAVYAATRTAVACAHDIPVAVPPIRRAGGSQNSGVQGESGRTCSPSPGGCQMVGVVLGGWWAAGWGWPAIGLPWAGMR